MEKQVIETPYELEEQILQWGFMPFFKSGIEGFSIEDIMPRELLFGEHGNPEEYGAWQWRGELISHWRMAYGKFFAGKAGYVSLEWLPDFMNMRRQRFPLDAYSEESLHILHTLQAHESLLSRALKKASGYTLSRRKRIFNPENPDKPLVNKRNGTSFDSQIAQLQMGTYVCIADFEYTISKKGKPYGWGLARYCTPEAMYEWDYRNRVEGRTPEQSRAKILSHLERLFPEASPKLWDKII